jgi:hypothetical protein
MGPTSFAITNRLTVKAAGVLVHIHFRNDRAVSIIALVQTHTRSLAHWRLRFAALPDAATDEFPSWLLSPRLFTHRSNENR